MQKINEQVKGTEQQIKLNQIACDIIKNMPMGVLFFDNNMLISDINEQGQIIFDAHLHQDLALVLTENYSGHKKIDWQEIISQTLTQNQSQKFDKLEFLIRRKTLMLRLIFIPVDKNCGLVLIEDISDYLKMQENLAASERMAAVGTLAAKVAHELNNPLDGIARYLNLTIRVLQNDGITGPIKYLQQCQQGIARMADIVRELLEFSRKPASCDQDKNINSIIKEAVKAMQPWANDKKIDIVCSLTNDIAVLRCGNLSQVFNNIIKNAIDAMAENGTIEIQSVVQNNIATITFTDSGTGIDNDDLEKIFEPFFTTKEKGKGTGLGLAICQDIVKRHNGSITATNRNDRPGAIFTITLPLEN